MSTVAPSHHTTLFPVQTHATLFTRAASDCGANAEGGRGFQPGNTCAKKDGEQSAKKPKGDKYLEQLAKEINDFLKSDEAVDAWKKYGDRLAGQQAFDPKTVPEFEANEFGLLRPKEDFRDGVKLGRLLEIRASMNLAEKLNLSSDDLKQFAADNPKTAAEAGDAFGVAQMFVTGWNRDSSDFESVALQTRAIEKLGIADANRPSWKEYRWGGEEGLKKYFETGVNQKVVDAVVEGIYDSTQKSLKDAGIETITVYRGKKGETPDEGGKRESIRNDTVKTNPLSAYSTSITQAEKFTQGDDETHGTIVGGVIPRARVFSVPSTGIGTMVESEVVVINDASKKMRVMSYKHKRKYGDDDRFVYDTSDLKERFWGGS